MEPSNRERYMWTRVKELQAENEVLEAENKELKRIREACREIYKENKRWVNDLAGDEASDALYFTMKRILKEPDGYRDDIIK